MLRLFSLLLAVTSLAACGGGSDSRTCADGAGDGSPITISGLASYDFVPHNNSNGLDYSRSFPAPVRAATVQAVGTNGQILASSQTDINGEYRLEIASNQCYRVRVRAESLLTSPATWNVRIVDNTNDSALYVLDSRLRDAVPTVDEVLNIHAASGWGGSSYTSSRAAAPFAILDSIVEAMLDTAVVDNNVNFPALTVNWSVNNKPAMGNIAAGEIGTSFYSNRNIFVLGAANNDTDEFDRHIIIHEWGHYFEDQLSRSDSIGGPHSGGEQLDMRVAMGEGFGNALSGIFTEDPFYRDSRGQAQAQGFSINVEANNSNGWFDEATVQSLLYDIADPANDDNIADGWAALYRSFTSTAYRNEAALSSIFSFANQYIAQNPSSATAVRAMLERRGINGNEINSYGSNEDNAAGNADDVLPIYTVLPSNGSARTVCSIDQFGTGNKLSTRRFLQVDIPVTANYRIIATGPSNSDPDLVIYNRGSRVDVLEENGNESAVRRLSAGPHVLEVYEFSNVAPENTGGARGRTCIAVSLNRS